MTAYAAPFRHSITVLTLAAPVSTITATSPSRARTWRRSSIPFMPGRRTSVTTSGGLQTLKTSRASRSEEHTAELQSRSDLRCRLLLDKKLQHFNLQAVALGVCKSASD